MKGVLLIGAMLAAAAVGVGGVIIQGDLRSISVNGLAPSYRDIALHYLREPAGMKESFADLRPFCGSDDLRAQLDQEIGRLQCIPFVKQVGDCNPVEARSKVPQYILPASDLLEVALVVTTSDVAGVASYIDRSSSIAIDEIGTLSGSQHEIIRQTKTVSSTQCEGYGYIVIRQHYFQE